MAAPPRPAASGDAAGGEDLAMRQHWLKKKVNALELYTIDVILGRRAGASAALYGAVLQALSWLWSAGAQAKQE